MLQSDTDQDTGSNRSYSPSIHSKVLGCERGFSTQNCLKIKLRNRLTQGLESTASTEDVCMKLCVSPELFTGSYWDLAYLHYDSTTTRSHHDLGVLALKTWQNHDWTEYALSLRKLEKEMFSCFLFSLGKMDVDKALAYFERLDNGDVSDVCAPSSEDEFVSSNLSVTPESSIGSIPSGGDENVRQ